MKARRLICKGTRQIEVEDFELGDMPAGGMLVKNDYTGISVGTELYNWMHGGNPGPNGWKAEFPRGTGYSSSGTVLAVGKDVTNYRAGDRVVGGSSHQSHGIYSAAHAYKVPDNVSQKAVGIFSMAGIAMHGIRVAKIELGEAVVVLGLGLVGQFAASLAKLAGAQPVIAIDLDPVRLEKAKARGADVCINPNEVDDVPAEVRKHCVEDGANVVMEATGKPAVYPMAVKLACIAGRLVAVGSPRGTVEMNFLDEVHLREVSILGAISPKTPKEDHIYFRFTKRREREMILRFMDEGRLTSEDLITHVAQPEECLDIYNMLADNPQGALGVVFEW